MTSCFRDISPNVDPVNQCILRRISQPKIIKLIWTKLVMWTLQAPQNVLLQKFLRASTFFLAKSSKHVFILQAKFQWTWHPIPNHTIAFRWEENRIKNSQFQKNSWKKRFKLISSDRTKIGQVYRPSYILTIKPSIKHLISKPMRFRCLYKK